MEKYGWSSNPLTLSLSLSEEEVEGSEVCGRCDVVCAEMMDEQERDVWFSQAMDRFYFTEVGVAHQPGCGEAWSGVCIM